MPTIKDVAKKANVSVATVSRVINNTGYVNEETRKLVVKAIDELGYIPNELARSLFRKQSKIIGVIVPHISTIFFAELIEAIEDALANDGYKLMIFNSRDDIEREKKYMSVFQQYNIDGIILVANTKSLKGYQGLNIPIITIDHKVGDNISSITSDNIMGGRLAAEKLIETGAKNIIHFRGPSVLLTVQDRAKGFYDVMRDHNIFAHSFDLDFKKPDIKDIEMFLKKHPDVDGIFCSSDTIAINVLRVLNKMHKRIPEDVQVIGFDNIDLCEFTTPSLTSIQQPIHDIAFRATELLIEQINKKDHTVKHHMLPVNLVERESTK